MTIASLAQFAPPPPPPPPLPGPGLLESLLLERPWPLIGLLVIAALGAAFALNARGRTRDAALAALAGLAAALGLYLLAALVTTDREAIRDRARTLVGAAARVQLDTLDELFAPDARLVYFESPRGLDKPAILDRVRTALGERWIVEEAAIVENQATLDGPNIARSQLHVRITPEATRAPHLSWWRIDWRREADGAWRIIHIQPLNPREL